MTKSNWSAAVKATGLRDHGIAVHNGMCLSMKTWRDAVSGRDYIYCGIISTTPLILQVDANTGSCRSFPMPPSASAPWAMALTLDGHVLATSFDGRLYRLDPRTGEYRSTDSLNGTIMGLDRGADGKYYIGSSPEARLFRYDAVTEAVEDLGPLGFGQTIVRKVVAGNDGYVYASIGCTASQIAAYHIASGRKTALLPKSEVVPYFLDEFGRGRDGNIYLVTNRGHGYRIEHGEAFPHADVAEIRRLLNMGEYWKGCNELADGRLVTPLDPDAVKIGEGPKAKIIRYTYKTGGANIFHLAEGPGKAVYGSTIMPLFLLRYTPATDKLENLGRGAPDNGEAYSIGHLDGKLYYGNYPSGNLMCYDPRKPWHKDQPGAMQWKTNPKWLGYLGKGNCRPRAMTIDGRKRIWLGGVPEYGFRHGGLASYDTRLKKVTVFDEVTPDQCIMALAADEKGEIVYGGTTIGRGGGLQPVTTEARFFAWDTRKKKTLWSIVPVSGMQSLSNLLYRNGKVYGTTASPTPGEHRFTHFCFDTKTRKMDYIMPAISGVREQSMNFGPDGNIYGITWMTLFRWHPATGKIEEIYRIMGEDAKPFGTSLFHGGAAIIDGRYYFSCGTRLMSVKLPMDKKRGGLGQPALPAKKAK